MNDSKFPHTDKDAGLNALESLNSIIRIFPMPTDFTHISTIEIKEGINTALRLCMAYETISFTGCHDCQMQIMNEMLRQLYGTANRVRAIFTKQGFETDGKKLLEIT